MKRLRVLLKTLLAKHFLIIEFCKECGRTQPLVWHAEDDVWELISGGMGILCPECFDKRAWKAGYALMWRPTKL